MAILQRFSSTLLLLLLGSAASASTDAPIVPHGTLESAGWALAKLNDGDCPPSEISFNYPDSTEPVRLYLIDTGIDNSSGWFEGNSNLTLTTTTNVGTPGIPSTPAAIKHGTQMLSIIAGPDSGAAVGTPIEVLNYNIYPDGDGSPSTVGLLIEALTAINLNELLNPGPPAIVCIANGSEIQVSGGTPGLLENAIDTSLSRGLTVIISAGNSGMDASLFVPSQFGSKAGVICVGATDQENRLMASSNFGSAVDIYAPGDGVGSYDPLDELSDQTTPMFGTSPATALATAAALSELSRQPDLDPAALEALLVEQSFQAEESSIRLVHIDDDFDDDGSPDALERLFGYSPLDGSSVPPAIGLLRSNDLSVVEFTIAEDLLDANNPNQLMDGSSWRLLASADLVVWTEVAAYTHVGSTENEKTTIRVVDGAAHEAAESETEASALIQNTVIQGPTTVLVGFEDNGAPILRTVEPGDEAAHLAVVTPPTTSVRKCFYRIEWLPAQ